MQSLELLGVLIVTTLIAVGIAEFRRRGGASGHQAAIVIGATGGITGAVVALTQQVDLMPDAIEAMVAPAFVIAVSAILLVAAGWARMDR